MVFIIHLHTLPAPAYLCMPLHTLTITNVHVSDTCERQGLTYASLNKNEKALINYQLAAHFNPRFAEADAEGCAETEG